MRQIEFSEDQLNNLDLVGAVLFSDPEDPRSSSYQRTLVRPKINWLAIAALCLLIPAAAVGLYFLLTWLQLAPGIALVISLGSLLGFILVHTKRILICLVRIYQRYAPASIRNKCRFEPSCSVYMLQCLEKYGLFRGLKKGINRLQRCNIDNGGFDYP